LSRGTKKRNAPNAVKRAPSLRPTIGVAFEFNRPGSRGKLTTTAAQSNALCRRPGAFDDAPAIMLTGGVTIA
jgi:hypothetical protein